MYGGGRRGRGKGRGGRGTVRGGGGDKSSRVKRYRQYMNVFVLFVCMYVYYIKIPWYWYLKFFFFLKFILKV